MRFPLLQSAFLVLELGRVRVCSGSGRSGCHSHDGQHSDEGFVELHDDDADF